MNDCYNVSETEAVEATGGKHNSCQSNEEGGNNRNQFQVMPIHTFKEVATKQNKDLSSLLVSKTINSS